MNQKCLQTPPSLPGGVCQPPFRSTNLLQLTLHADIISHHLDFKKLCMFQTVQPQSSYTVIQIRILDAWGLSVEEEVDLLRRGWQKCSIFWLECGLQKVYRTGSTECVRKTTGGAWVKGPQADKPDADVLPNILASSLSFLASKGALLGDRLPHSALARPDVIMNGNCGHWTPVRWLS